MYCTSSFFIKNTEKLIMRHYAHFFLNAITLSGKNMFQELYECDSNYEKNTLIIFMLIFYYFIQPTRASMM